MATYAWSEGRGADLQHLLRQLDLHGHGLALASISEPKVLKGDM